MAKRIPEPRKHSEDTKHIRNRADHLTHAF
jgi:hypothetical protein